MGTLCSWMLWMVPASGSEPTNGPLLTIDRLFDSAEFNAEAPGVIVWSRRGSGYYTLDKPANSDSGKDLVLNDPATGKKEIILPAHAFVPPGEPSPLPVESFEFSGDESKLLIFTNGKRVWRRNDRGDYWVLDVTSRELRKLGGDAAPSTLRFAKFSPDGTRVAYVREGNLHVQRLRDLQVTPLTTNASPSLVNGTFDWVYEEELDLRDGYRWSPDGRSIAYWQIDSAGVRDFQLINNTDSFYPRATAIPYPKTGEQNPAARIGVIGADGGETRWMALPGDLRDHYLARMDWASNSTEVIVQQFNRLQNTNRVFLADAAAGEARALFAETDAAWVENENEIRWIGHGSRFLWLSERDGWRHAYTVSRKSGHASKVTTGDFDVIAIEGVDEKNGWLYYTASPHDASQRHLYRVPLDGGKSHRVTPDNQSGTHTYQISPDGGWAIHTFSTFANPPVTDLVRLPAHKSIRVIEDNKKLREKLDALRRPGTGFFRIDIGNNVLLDGWSVLPPGFDPARKYPVLFYVYGEPHGQTVRDVWGGRNHLWHWMLAQEGCVVMSIDNRGTRAPRGRDWRKMIYRQVGILASSDQAAAVRAILKQRPYLDPNRVAVWGWSGGGSMALNAIFRHPDLYQTAMAVAAVPNQRYYDTIYQERYMGLPEGNPDGYRLGSPLTYARQLKGNLLIVHGTGDDNVHYQGTEALINELIAYNKPFTMMAYPNRTHGIGEGRNTTRHLYGLLTRFLTQNLPLEVRPPAPPLESPATP
jgi:dipeptidyl-peptidase-4